MKGGILALWAALLQSVFLLALCAPASAADKDEGNLQHFIFVGGDRLSEHEALLARDDVDGAQVVYHWRGLEPHQGHYDFDRIEADLEVARTHGKKLFIQIQDRFFLPKSRFLPDYILQQPAYGGGLVRQEDNPGEGAQKGSGWVAAQWNEQLRARYQALLAALGERFDGRVYGINLPETAIDIPTGVGAPEGFSCDNYFDAEIENIIAARNAFSRSLVVQYVNFWPCEWNNDRRYMERFFDLAAASGIGAGGPDIIPYRRAQERNAYRFLESHGDRLPVVAMAVQAPTLTYTNPHTGEKFTRAEFEHYAVTRLKVDIIFWSLRSPWLAGD